MQTKHSPRIWFYFITPLIAVIVTLIITEVLLTIFYPVPFSAEVDMYFEPDPYTGFRIKPNAVGYYQGTIPANANKHGHRDEYVSLQKPAGVFRILVLGDSFTVGANVSQEEAYPEVLEVLLNKDSLMNVEVINAGVSAWEPFQYAQYYEYYGWKFLPDLVLVGFFVGNDTYALYTEVNQLPTAVLGRRVSRDAASSPFTYLKVFLYSYSNIARLIFTKGPVIYNAERDNCADFNEIFINIQRTRRINHQKRDDISDNITRNIVKQIKHIEQKALQNATPVIVLLIPDENNVNPALQQILLNDPDIDELDFEMPQAMLKSMFSEINIPYIDLLPYFRNDPRCLYMNDTHWTAEGHELAASIIFEYLTNEGLFPTL